MTNAEMVDVQKDMLQIKESLDEAMNKAGGAPLRTSVLKGMTALDFLSLLSTNNVRFIYAGKKK